MRKLTILCDLDSIVADFYGACLEAYGADTGTNPPWDLISSWDFEFPNGKTCYNYFTVPGFFRDLKPVPGALESLKEIHDAGHTVLIVSSATNTSAPGEKYEWLSEHLPWLSRDNVYFCRQKYRIRGDVLIDDYQLNAREYRHHNPQALILGLKYPYNRDHQDAFHLLAPETGAMTREGLREGWGSIVDRVLAHAFTCTNS
jgi:5'(3')-deoxyribonucleotidase